MPYTIRLVGPPKSFCKKCGHTPVESEEQVCLWCMYPEPQRGPPVVPDKVVDHVSKNWKPNNKYSWSHAMKSKIKNKAKQSKVAKAKGKKP